MAENTYQGMLLDSFHAGKLLSSQSYQRTLKAWLYIPFGITLILLLCFGVDSLISLSTVSFPASVVVLLALFFSLILCNICIGDRRTRAVVAIIDVPAGFALRWINIFFTPSFVLLPLSPAIGGVEVAKIIAVFLIGFMVMLAITAYIVRGLQLLLGSSKRAITERAEEMGAESDEIPLAETRPPSILPPSLTPSTLTLPAPSLAPGSTNPPSPPPEPVAPLQPPQTPLPLTRPQRWAAKLNPYLDTIVYLVIFLFIGLPIYYATSYAMPAQLTLTVLFYFLACSIPPTYRRFLHPVLVASALTILGVWVLGAIRGDTLKEVLGSYKRGAGYLAFWHNTKGLSAPGAGDIFASILDASIVALALPMYNYRSELKRHFFAIVVPNVTLAVLTLFIYPPLCFSIGITPARSLSFAARSLTLALAIPATENLDGDVNTVAALAITSGILGALIGNRLLRLLRIPEDDYITRGVTLGANSSAIATAFLLVSDPRAAALSSLSMSLFGIITLGLTSVPAIVVAVRSLAGL